jgi:Domain of unknown function (DUF4193)
MKETVSDVDEPTEDEETEQDLDDLEPPAEELAEGAAATPEPAAEGEVESIEELLVKKEAQSEEAEADEEEETLVTLTREERLVEPLDAKVVPPTTSEFVCKRCFLVKHKSQLKDKKRMLCRDCA